MVRVSKIAALASIGNPITKDANVESIFALGSTSEKLTEGEPREQVREPRACGPVLLKTRTVQSALVTRALCSFQDSIQMYGHRMFCQSGRAGRLEPVKLLPAVDNGCFVCTTAKVPKDL